MAKPLVKSWKITSHPSVSQQGLKLCPAHGETEAQSLSPPKVRGLCSDATSVTSTGFSPHGCGSLPCALFPVRGVCIHLGLKTTLTAGMDPSAAFPGRVTQGPDHLHVLLLEEL